MRRPPGERLPGRQSKGPRHAFSFRVPTDLYDAFDKQCSELGYETLSDYLNVLVAEAVGHPVPDYVKLPVDRELQQDLLAS